VRLMIALALVAACTRGDMCCSYWTIPASASALHGVD
jgi:hypothetical protein